MDIGSVRMDIGSVRIHPAFFKWPPKTLARIGGCPECPESSLVPLSVMHRAINDTELQRYKIPQGSIIIPLLYSASYDPKYWVDAETFNPDRFINKTGKLIKNDALMPFSVGPRTCLGEPLAKMELFLVLANLLQEFTFSREDESIKHSLKPKESQITNSPAQYKLGAQKR